MSEIPPSSPPPKGIPPEPIDGEKAKNIAPKPEDVQSDGQFEYMGFTFTSEKAYKQFKDKFLAQMANIMIQQIKSENDRMVKALKKMREDQS